MYSVTEQGVPGGSLDDQEAAEPGSSAFTALDVDAEDPHALGVDSFGGSHGLGLQGDFYFQPDDVKRGVTQVSDPVAEGLFGSSEFSKSLEPYGCDLGAGSSWYVDAPMGLQRPSLSRDSPFEIGEPLAYKAPPVGSFTDMHAPAEVPFGGLSATTLSFHNATAAELANCVHEFLAELPSTSFQKVRLEKFAINAEIFCEIDGCLIGGSCTIKARVFSASAGAMAGERGPLFLEFRRRGGDALNFAHAFEQAERFLSQKLGGLDIPEAAAGTLEATGRPEGIEPAEDPCVALQPLLDMLGAACTTTAMSTTTAAEAVTALASLAGDARSVAEISRQLEITNGLKPLAALVSSQRLADSYPAACLATQLAQHGSGLVLAEPLLQAVCSAVAASGTDHMVRLQLAETLRAAAECCDFAPGALRQRLALALQSQHAHEEAGVAESLTRAYQTLASREGIVA